MSITRFFDSVGAPLANQRWAYGARRARDGVSWIQSPPSVTAGVNAAHFTLPLIFVPLPAMPLIVNVPPAPSRAKAIVPEPSVLPLLPTLIVLIA